MSREIFKNQVLSATAKSGFIVDERVFDIICIKSFKAMTSVRSTYLFKQIKVYHMMHKLRYQNEKHLKIKIAFPWIVGKSKKWTSITDEVFNKHFRIIE